MATAYKFGWVPGDECSYDYGDIFAIEKTSGPYRLVIAPSAHHISVMTDLIKIMPEPFGILYVLTVPRGGEDAGRYQAVNLLSRTEVEGFLYTFQEFFEGDARHHIWIVSASSSDVLVYDKHNVIYAYGRLPEFETVVLNRGLTKAEFVRCPSPHIHNYYEAFDQSELAVLRYWDWKQSPLKDSDE
jgi:hypothetical protein